MSRARNVLLSSSPSAAPAASATSTYASSSSAASPAAVSSSASPEVRKKAKPQEEVKIYSAEVEYNGKKYEATPYFDASKGQNLQGWRIPYLVPVDKEKYVVDITPYSTSNLYKYKGIPLEATDIFSLEAKHDNRYKPMYRITVPYSFEPSQKDRSSVSKFAEALWKLNVFPIFNQDNFASYKDELKVVLVERLLEGGTDRSDFDAEDIADPKDKKAYALEYIKSKKERSKRSLLLSLSRIGVKKTVDLENETKRNQLYRRVIYTGTNSQVVLMRLEEGSSISDEVHEGEQFIRVEDGEILVEFTANEASNISSASVKEGQSIVIPYKQKHKVTAVKETHLYSVYSFNKDKAIHEAGTIHENKEDADRQERQGKKEPKAKNLILEDKNSSFDKILSYNGQEEEEQGGEDEEEQGGQEEDGQEDEQ